MANEKESNVFQYPHPPAVKDTDYSFQHFVELVLEYKDLKLERKIFSYKAQLKLLHHASIYDKELQATLRDELGIGYRFVSDGEIQELIEARQDILDKEKKELLFVLENTPKQELDELYFLQAEYMKLMHALPDNIPSEMPVDEPGAWTKHSFPTLEMILSASKMTDVPDAHPVKYLLDHLHQMYSVLHERAMEYQKQILCTKIIKNVSGIDSIVRGTDKASCQIWGKASEVLERYIISAENEKDRKNGIELNIIVSITFPDWLHNKYLNYIDQRIYNAIGTLYDAGYRIVTLTQIYKTAFGDHNPAPHQLKVVSDSIIKMSLMYFSYDNTSEAERYKYQIMEISTRYLLKTIRDDAFTENGVWVKNAITIEEEPILFTIAKARKNITTIKREVLQIPNFSNTNINVGLIEYLSMHIARGSKVNKKEINVDTIYKKLNIPKSEKKVRIRKKVEKILDHFVATNFLKGYEIRGDKIIMSGK